MMASGGPLRPSGRLARLAATIDSSFHAGRSTPRVPPLRATSGAESVPAGKGTSRASPCAALGGGYRRKSGCKVQAPCFDADASSLVRTRRAESPPARILPNATEQVRAKRQAASSSPPRCRDGSATPPAPRSSSPARSEKDLPPSWKRLVESAYRDETGRPIADRICLSDFTSARNSKSETLFWINARVRWGDLIITESGRVPQRGEDLVLFVLHGPGSAPRAGSPKRAAPCAPIQRHGRRSHSPQRNHMRSWRVGSCRVIRHLPFSELGNMCLAADAGGAFFRMVLAGQLFPEAASTEESSCSYVVHPPQTYEAQARSHQNPASAPNHLPGAGPVSPRRRKQPIRQISASKR